MGDNQPPDRPAADPRNGRPTIGFIINHLSSKNTCTIWQGVVDAARERGVNVITFLAHDLDTPLGFEAQANVFYDLASGGVLDGLVIWSAPFTSYAGREGAQRVLERYQVPIVAIEGGGPDGIPRMEIEHYQSQREAVLHLVKEHGYRRVAFIRGPDTTHAGALERYQAYLDVLAEYGLPVDPDLITPSSEGRWGPEVGEAAIALLVDERRANFEAIAAANDHFALGAMRALQARGIHIPDQVAIVGFDDNTGSDSVIPPLTTISQQGYEQGRGATEMLLTLLEGGHVPERVGVPPKLLIRQSCGCTNPAVVQASVGSAAAAGDKPLKVLKAAQRKAVLSEIRQAAQGAARELAPIGPNACWTASSPT